MQLILTNEQLESINSMIDSIIFEENNFINMDYINKFKNLKSKKPSNIELNDR